MVDRKILGYNIEEKIGEGGYGVVYKVSKTNPSGTYIRALKHISLPTKKQYNDVLNSMGGDYAKTDKYFEDLLKDIINEIKIISMLSEEDVSNIVRYYENDIRVTESPRKYDIYILMEYLTSFLDYFDQQEMRVKDVIRLGKDILTALIECHGRGVIHRDIKADNIFVNSKGVFKLGDFGISKILDGQSKATSIKGTLNYIAPEVYLGKEKYDETIDLYSLGILLYRLLNRNRYPFLPPFPERYSVTDEENAFGRRIKGDVPEFPVEAKNELGNVVVKALLPKKDRYKAAREFLNELEHAEANLSVIELDKIINNPDMYIKRGKNDNTFADTEKTALMTEDTVISSELTNTLFVEEEKNLSHKHNIIATAIIFVLIFVGIIGINIGLKNRFSDANEYEEIGEKNEQIDELITESLNDIVSDKDSEGGVSSEETDDYEEGVESDTTYDVAQQDLSNDKLSIIGNDIIMVGDEVVFSFKSESFILLGDSEGLMWRSSDESIVSVNNGKVKANGIGDAVVTCDYNGVEIQKGVHVVDSIDSDIIESSITKTTLKNVSLLGDNSTDVYIKLNDPPEEYLLKCYTTSNLHSCLNLEWEEGDDESDAVLRILPPYYKGEGEIVIYLTPKDDEKKVMDSVRIQVKVEKE